MLLEKQDLLHTPEGVRDIYNVECEQKLALEAGMMSAMRRYGYHPIQTPMFEYFDIFGKEIGSTPSQDLFKFFDKDGNTLVLRPEITPSIARCAAKYYMDTSVPIRFCYKGNTFINKKSYRGHLKECTQQGAELVGDGSVDADAEIIALAIRLLLGTGLQEFQISVGHVDYLNGLMEAAGMDAETETRIWEFIRNKNYSAIEKIVSELHLEPNLTELFRMIGQFQITQQAVKRALEIAAPYPKVYASLKRLEELEEILKLYGVEQYVYYEPAMYISISYYTGIIFAGYTYGTGEAIVRGGRYDDLLPYFGKNAPAIGFALIVDQVMAALKRQNLPIPVEEETIWLLYREEERAPAIRKAARLRGAGEHVELMKYGSDEERTALIQTARQSHVRKIISCDRQEGGAL